ncbi:iron complex transport system ATP-binding protein [Breoghania corrubedonensis]|uniref:Iron complex transport system ATP-binding protein n=1 Tax=Breoghania corrubedonensis TaxID=665038 RepID=A0A2T5V6L9_9HYPH|nr:ABC transporter ATP-binding protein [Breoghania corrubedonensis]PTW59376.1 iron complex transport system ATP-binding protein [Breoghania corrubedonensis]
MSSSLLTIRDLCAGYGRRRIIETLSVPAIEGGSVTALLGPNAAGKTTLLRALAGLLPMTGGLDLCGEDLTALSVAERASRVTYMPQSLPQRVALTVFEAVLAALRASPLAGMSPEGARNEAMRALERLGIADLALSSLDELSGGQRQLASLAQAIVRSPRVLLLDEPTSALDLNHQHKVMALVEEVARERGIVAIIVLHDIALACRWCKRVMVFSKGAVVADGTPEKAVTPEVLAAVYGVSARVERCSRGFLQVSVDGPA